MKNIMIKVLLCNVMCGSPALMYGMSQAGGPTAFKATQQHRSAMARKKFTSAYLTQSVWPKISSFVSQWWKVFAEPKRHYFRVAQMQKEASKEGSKEVAKQEFQLPFEETEKKEIDLDK